MPTFNPNWHEAGFFPFLVLFGSYFWQLNFYKKIPNFCGGGNWHQSGWFDTLPSSLSLIKKCFKLHLTFKKVSHSYSWPYRIQNCLSIFHNNSFQMKFSIFVHCVIAGQLVSSEVLMASELGCPIEMHRIPIEKCDEMYDPECKGDTFMPFHRALYDKDTNQSLNMYAQRIDMKSTEITKSLV